MPVCKNFMIQKKIVRTFHYPEGICFDGMKIVVRKINQLLVNHEKLRPIGKALYFHGVTFYMLFFSTRVLGPVQILHYQTHIPLPH